MGVLENLDGDCSVCMHRVKRPEGPLSGDGAERAKLPRTVVPVEFLCMELNARVARGVGAAWEGVEGVVCRVGLAVCA